MLSKLITLLQQKNEIIRNINFSIVRLNVTLKHIIEKNPEIVNYSWEPLDTNLNEFVRLDYPFIYVEILPFKTKIDCEKLIAEVNGDFNENTIEKVLIDLLIHQINN